MNVRNANSRRVVVLVTALLGALSGTAMAQNHNGGGGGHASGGGHAAAAAPRSGRAGGAYARGGGYARGGSYGGHYAAPTNRSAPYARPGYSGGYGRSGYAGYGHPGYGGYGRGYGYGGYGRGWGGGGYWRGGVWFGGFVAALPLYYDTFWWGGVPYYYADDTYYAWSGAANQYQVVPPPGETAPVDGGADAQPSSSPDLVVYPNNGQSEEQQSKDRYECYHWAANQSGFDPTQPNGGQGASAPANRDGYMRAEAACLEGRGYTVK
jgi:hypothetical protein